MEKVLILGSSGFLGAKVLKLISAKAYSIDAVDLNTSYILKNNINHHKMDVTEFIKMKNYNLSEYNYIIDTATVLPFKNNKKKLMDKNIFSVQEIVNSRFDENVFFIYVSSSGTYGIPEETPIRRSTKQAPLDLYGDSKLEAEKLLLNNKNLSNLSIIRPKAILGESRGGIFEIFFKLIEKGIPIPLPNNGNQIMQFVDVIDVARFVEHIMENKITGIWPAAAPNPLKLNLYLDKLETKFNKKIRRINIYPKAFLILGYILVNLKLINFTKWHFGGYAYNSYFDDDWKLNDFKYEYDSYETLLRTAKFWINKN
tara:strand:- start:677 stop:1615 length:939 start_codon:yes stop_codon:yes gene_type:complete